MLGMSPWKDMLAVATSARGQRPEDILGPEPANFRTDPVTFLAQMALYLQHFDKVRVETLDP